jgi:hypothetical protein
VVLLDEYWVPEIAHNDVGVQEIDTLNTGDPGQAKFGECSALLTNTTGWPNVRFPAARVALSEMPPEESDAALWYRTDAWVGRWRLEVWFFYHAATEAPVKVLEATLDGGEADGRLIADDGWHEARGILREAEAYGSIPPDAWGVSYVWLAPEEGWDIEHKTYIDRVEVDVLAGPLAETKAEPPRRARPRPGAQTHGKGWVWFEAEDAVEHTLPPPVGHNVSTAEGQSKLSNGAWLGGRLGPEATARYELDIAEAGEYHLWGRGCLTPTPLRWRWNGGAWQQRDDASTVFDRVMIRDGLGVWWFRVDDVTLGEGTATFEIEGRPDGAGALDCWLLTQGEFTPDGHRKPGEE